MEIYQGFGQEESWNQPGLGNHLRLEYAVGDVFDEQHHCAYHFEPHSHGSPCIALLTGFRSVEEEGPDVHSAGTRRCGLPSS